MRNSRISAFSAADREILFVFGTARSGTTFLNNILDQWFDYGMGPEENFVPFFSRRLWRYGELSKAVNLARLVDDISHCKMLEIPRSKYPPGVRFDVTPELIHEHLLEPTYAGVVYSVFECMAELQHRKRVGNKNPSYWAHLDLLAQLFPSQAKYLCIVRDGRDVALSRMKLKWGRTSVFACARTLVESLRAVEDFQKH